MILRLSNGISRRLNRVMLEYMFSRYEVSEDHHQSDESDDDDDRDSEDLSEAGGEWLADQGFDSHE